MSANSTNPSSTPEGAPAFPCVCAAIRRAGRTITRRYDAILKPVGLKITQFSMLANIGRNPGISVSRLAELLLMDQTTVTRNLGVLEKAGYVQLLQTDADRRSKRVEITAAGRDKMAQARPYWQQAQREIEGELGGERITALLEIFARLA